MNRIIAAIWAAMLLATVVGVVPAVVGLLRRALTAARNIERYTAEILDAGVGIADNTRHVAALKQTRAVAPGLVAEVQSIERHAATIAGALGNNATTPENTQ